MRSTGRHANGRQRNKRSARRLPSDRRTVHNPANLLPIHRRGKHIRRSSEDHRPTIRTPLHRWPPRPPHIHVVHAARPGPNAGLRQHFHRPVVVCCRLQSVLGARCSAPDDQTRQARNTDHNHQPCRDLPFHRPPLPKFMTDLSASDCGHTLPRCPVDAGRSRVPERNPAAHRVLLAVAGLAQIHQSGGGRDAADMALAGPPQAPRPTPRHSPLPSTQPCHFLRPLQPLDACTRIGYHSLHVVATPNPHAARHLPARLSLRPSPLAHTTPAVGANPPENPAQAISRQPAPSGGGLARDSSPFTPAPPGPRPAAHSCHTPVRPRPAAAWCVPAAAKNRPAAPQEFFGKNSYAHDPAPFRPSSRPSTLALSRQASEPV